jgi:drug/metabolite transporter (DMT)-like permease
VARGYVALLLLVAGIWGASFMFIKVAVDEIDPIPLMAFRLALSALTLLPFLMLQNDAGRALADLRESMFGVAFLGLVNSALPFTLIAWGEQHIDSSIAAIANAPVPIFVALLALKYKHSERVTGLRLLGIVIGFLGVAVLTGLNPEGGWWAVGGTLAVVAAALCYAISNLFAQARFQNTQPLVVVTGSSLTGALFLLPIAAVQLPTDMPSREAVASVVALGVGGTAIALILYFRMLSSYGASRSSLVTYLIPLIAVVYGVTILDERLRANAVAGLALILGGVALGSGVWRLGRRRQVAPVAPRP